MEYVYGTSVIGGVERENLKSWVAPRCGRANT